MSNTSVRKLHPSFALNGICYSEESLKTYAGSLLKNNDDEKQAIGRFILEWLGDDLYVSVKTSGSTGTPKNLKIAKQFMANSAKATGEFFNVFENAAVLLCLSANYIAGKMMLVRAMTLGWNLNTVTPSNFPLKTVNIKYDFCAMVPTQLSNSLKKINCVSKLIVGGAPVSQNLIKLIQSKQTKIYETYGMTETVSHVAVRRLNSKSVENKDSFFKTLPNVKVAVDQRNCLVINAPLVAKETIITNDIVTLMDANTFLWKGRFDNVINSGGIKIFPEEVERKLQNSIEDRFLISWIPNPKLGQQVILIIENSKIKASQSIDKDSWYKKSKLTKYEIPKQVFYLDQFIETPSGKIHRERNRMLVVKDCF